MTASSTAPAPTPAAPASASRSATGGYHYGIPGLVCLAGGGFVARFNEFKEANERYVASFDKDDMPIPPARQVAVVTCLDARLQLEEFLGLEARDAHIINAGGRVSEDAIHALVSSERLLGIDEIVVIHHTDRGPSTRRSPSDTGLKRSVSFPRWGVRVRR